MTAQEGGKAAPVKVGPVSKTDSLKHSSDPFYTTKEACAFGGPFSRFIGRGHGEGKGEHTPRVFNKSINIDISLIE